MNKIYKLKSNAPIRHNGKSLLVKFLDIPHTGAQIGNRIILFILSPTTKKKKDIELNTQTLVRLYLATPKSKWANEISWGVDRMGHLANLSVPSNWLESI